MPQICPLVWVKFEEINLDVWSQILSMFQSHVFKKPGCKDIKDMTDDWLNWCWVDTESYELEYVKEKYSVGNHHLSIEVLDRGFSFPCKRFYFLSIIFFTERFSGCQI